MITAGAEWRYIAVKNYLHCLDEKHQSMMETFIFKIAFIRIEQNKLKKHENVCKNYDYHFIKMPKEDNKNIIIPAWRKIYESSIYYLSWNEVFTWKNEHLP